MTEHRARPPGAAHERLESPPPERAEGERSDYDDLEGDVKAAVGRFVADLWNKHDIDACERFVAEDFVDHDPYPGQGKGQSGFRAYAQAFLEAFPDVLVTIDDMIWQGSKCAMRLTWTATHRGEYLGVAPSGRTVVGRQMEFVRVLNGRIVERWALLDRPWLAEQLEAVAAASRMSQRNVPEISSTDDARSA